MFILVNLDPPKVTFSFVLKWRIEIEGFRHFSFWAVVVVACCSCPVLL